MNRQVYARVVGHKLFTPNPKDAPNIEVAKVSLVIASMSQHTTKSTVATVHVDVDDTNDAFALGRILRLTAEDHQQESDLAGGRPPLVVDGEKFDPETGESMGSIRSITLGMPDGTSVTATPGRMREALDQVKAGRRGGSTAPVKN